MLRRGGKVETLSRSSVKFLTAIREVCWGIKCFRFLRKILQGAALNELMAVGHFWWFVEKFSRPKTMRMSKIHRCIQAVCDGFMVSEFGTVVKCNRFYGLGKVQKHWQNGVSDGVSSLIFDVCHRQKPRLAFAHCHKITLPTNQFNSIAFPMAKFRSGTEIYLRDFL